MTVYVVQSAAMPQPTTSGKMSYLEVGYGTRLDQGTL